MKIEKLAPPKKKLKRRPWTGRGVSDAGSIRRYCVVVASPFLVGWGARCVASLWGGGLRPPPALRRFAWDIKFLI